MNSESLQDRCPSEDELLRAARGDEGTGEVKNHLETCAACRLRAEMMAEYVWELSDVESYPARMAGSLLVDIESEMPELALAAVSAGMVVGLVRSLHTEDGLSVLRVLHDRSSDTYEFWLLSETPVPGAIVAVDSLELLLDEKGHAFVPTPQVPDIKDAQIRLSTPVAVFELTETIRETLLADGRFVFEDAKLPPVVVEFSRGDDEQGLILRLEPDGSGGMYRVAVYRTGAEATLVGPVSRSVTIPTGDPGGMRLLFFVG